MHLQQQFNAQQFANEYQLVDWVAMHLQNPTSFHIPPDVIKRHIKPGQFVELRIDSPRFSVHENAAEKCACQSCQGEMTKPVLKHDHPASLVPVLLPKVASRGWGEDFWAQIVERSGHYFRGIVDNQLAEARLHGLNQSAEVIFTANHILAVHNIHRPELVAGMDVADLKELAEWVGQMRRSS